MRPVVLLDCDGVLANLIGMNLRVLAHAGIVRQHDDVTAWDLADCLGLTESERAALKRSWSRPGFCADIPPYPGAAEAVATLREIADVYAVTAPMSSNPTWMHERREWLKAHMGFVGDSDIIQTSAKHLVRGDLFVEDKASTLQRWAYAWPNGTPVLWRQRYNDNERAPGRGWHVNHWPVVIRLAREIAEAVP